MIFRALFSAALLAGCVTEEVVREKPESERVLEGLFLEGTRPDVLTAPGSAWDELRRVYDADGNGEIEPAELEGRDFLRFDRNRDGVIDLEDFPVESGKVASWAYDRLERVAALDVLRRGLGVGDAQATKPWQERFRELDLNVDLGLDRAEFGDALGAVPNTRRDGFSALLDLIDGDQNDRVDWPELAAALP